MERKKLAPGVFITTLDAEKFNRCRITIHLRYPALRRSATDAAVLPLVLERGYAAIRKDGKYTGRVSALGPGDKVDIIMADGARRARIFGEEADGDQIHI